MNPNAGVRLDASQEDWTAAPRDAPERVNVLGVGISAITMADALAMIDRWIATGASRYVCVTGVHGVMESQADPALREIHNRAGLVTPDGMPLVWLSWLHGHRRVERVYGPDLMLACCEASVAKGYRHFLYGGGEGVPERLAARLQERFPGLMIAGTWSPPFRELTGTEEQAMIDTIASAQPDIIWIGLSTPKQERWMARYVGRLPAAVLIGVGAAFDIHAGVKPASTSLDAAIRPGVVVPSCHRAASPVASLLNQQSSVCVAALAPILRSGSVPYPYRYSEQLGGPWPGKRVRLRMECQRRRRRFLEPLSRGIFASCRTTSSYAMRRICLGMLSGAATSICSLATRNSPNAL